MKIAVYPVDAFLLLMIAYLIIRLVHGSYGRAHV